MTNLDRAYEANNGVVVTEDGPYITGGLSSPVGLDLPVRTIYLQQLSIGLIYWRKFGAGVNDWRQLSAQDIPFNTSSLTGNSSDLGSVESTQQLGEALANRSFGKRHQLSFIDETLSTTSTTFVDVNTITTPSIELGNYLVQFNASFLKSLVAGQIEARFFLNNTTEFSLSQVSMNARLFFYNNTFMTILQNISGVNTIAFQFRKANGGQDISAKNRLLTFWRVS